MLFGSISFILFTLFLVSIFYLTPDKYRRGVLLLFSIIFYLSFTQIGFIILLFLFGFNYLILKFAELKLDYRKLLIRLLVFANIASLFFIKYIIFLQNNIDAILGIKINLLDNNIYYQILPIGISFFIFKLISFNIEFLRGSLQKKVVISDLFIYLFYFPEVLSGPIDKPQKFISQLEFHNSICSIKLKPALFFIGIGLIKKIIISDRLSYYVTSVYDNPDVTNGFQLLVATIFYSFQIYADFSGYTDIAIGISLLFGIEITNNFRYPYFSKSIKEFWTRWHITLSTFLRDYLFLPIAYKFARLFDVKMFKRKVSENLNYSLSIIITMFIAGIWHGPNWTFVLWGLLLGFYMVISKITEKNRRKLLSKLNLSKKIRNNLKIITTFFLISISWVFFRAESIHDAIIIFDKIFSIIPQLINPAALINMDLRSNIENITMFELFFNCILIISFIMFEYFYKENKLQHFFKRQSTYVKIVFISFMILFILLFGNFSSNYFIYFNF